MYKEEKIWKFRTWFYIIVILAIVGIAVYKCSSHKSPPSQPTINFSNLAYRLPLADSLSLGIEEITDDKNCFWPPDFIPHPHPPQPEPKDDNMAYKFSLNQGTVLCMEDNVQEPDCFWPPDLVPHPHPPSEPKKEPEMS